MSNQECETMGLKDVYMKMLEALQEIVHQQAKMFFETMNKAVNETGNTMDMKGEKTSPKHIIDMLEMMYIDFDDNRQPILPTILPATKGNESLLQAVKGLEKEPYKTMFAELIVRKRREYLDREGNRKLVG
jgi:hypothetical protein